jgi:SWI/SNF-related matrix-associated actin-dependent regulator 1 of chromatin subfamily A
MGVRLKWKEESGRYEAETDSPADRFGPKTAGFRWDPTNFVWWTDDHQKAAKLRHVADEQTSAQIESVLGKAAARFELSRATDAATIDLPVPDGLEYLAFQRVGIAYALGRDGTLFGDEMGLGKTIQALGVLNSKWKPGERMYVLVICPASLRINWAREAAKWLVSKPTIDIIQGSVKDRHCEGDGDIIMTIVNYDVLKRHVKLLHCREWDVMIADESHYLKNPKAARTSMVLGKRGKQDGKWIWKTAAIKAKCRLFLTGTPIVNRPVEIWPVANSLAPSLFNSWWRFVHRYCAAVRGRFGMDVSGASNLDEFQRLAREAFMVRRLKKEVLTELPAKRRQVIDLPVNGCAKAVEQEREAWRKHHEKIQELRAACELAKASENESEYRDAVEKLKEGCSVAFTEIARERHRVAVEKIPAVVTFVKDALESIDKIVVFAHHRDVVAAICEQLAEFGVVSITGSTPMGKRQDAVDQFQNDPKVRVFVGNMKAAGVGLTLTAASTVAFAELDWVPGNVSQAEDRCHRIGQAESVLVYHLVFDGSLDSRIARALVSKQRVIDAALDDEVKWQEPEIVSLPTAEKEEPASGKVTRKKIEKEAPKLTVEQVEAIHLGLRMLAGMCDGARALDGAGFNKMDTRIGHELAAQAVITKRQAALGLRFVTKYRRQLPDKVLAAAQGNGNNGVGA